jgi:CheY-like chemotaxis protein
MDEAGIACDVHVVEDGAEVLRYFADIERDGARAPDLLLLDLNMPKCSGDEILQQLRSRQAFAGIPVVVLTSSVHPRDRETALALGVVQYFTKPADYEAFMKIGDIVKQALMPAQ